MILSDPGVVEVAGVDPAGVMGVDIVLEDPAGEEVEVDESDPWVLADMLPPEAAELFARDEAELPDAGAATPELMLDDDGDNAAVPADVPNGDDAAVADETGVDAAVPEEPGADAVLAEDDPVTLAEAGAVADKLAEAGIDAAERDALAGVAPVCWAYGEATRLWAAVTPVAWFELEDPVEAGGTKDEPA